MDPNFLKGNFEYFRLSTAKDDENLIGTVQALLSFWPNKLLKFVFEPEKMGQKLMKLSGTVGFVYSVISGWFW